MTYHPFHDASGPLVRNSAPDLTELLPNFLIGEYPRPEDVGWLRAEHGVSAVVNLQDDDDLAAEDVSLRALERAYAAHGVEFYRRAIPDYDAAQLAASLDTLLPRLAHLLAAGHRVYLHCNAGMNRAPTVAIAYLHVYAGYSLEAARDLVKSRRACAPYMQLLRAHFAAPAV